MTDKKKKKPLDAGVDRLYQAARRGVRNRESAQVTKNHMRHILSETDTQNQKWKEKMEKAEAVAEEAQKELESVQAENKDLVKDLETANASVESLKEENAKLQEGADKASKELAALKKKVKELEKKPAPKSTPKEKKDAADPK